VLQNIADSRPKVRYIVAVDDSKTKLLSIVKVLHLFWYIIITFIKFYVFSVFILFIQRFSAVVASFVARTKLLNVEPG